MQKIINKLPRWTVLQIDIFVCLVSALMAYYLRYNFDIPDYVWQQMYMTVPNLMLTKLVFFFTTRSYTGIIRYTSIEDAKRIFISLTSALAIMLGVNIIFFQIYDYYFVPLSILLIDYLAASLFMASFRILAKIAYYEWQNSEAHRKTNVIIYGAGEAGLITKRTIDRDFDINQKVVAFVDDDRNLVNKSLEGIRIFHARRHMGKLIQTKKVELVIIAIQKISVERKKKIIDTCLSYGVQVRNVPPVEKWINGELSFKQIQNVKIEDVLGRDTIKLDKSSIASDISGKKVLISGAAGSIGSQIVREVIKFNPAQLILIDHAESPLYDLELEVKGIETKHSIRYEFVLADIRDQQRMEVLFKKYQPDMVYHAAAYKHVPVMEENPFESVTTNILGTKIMADLSVKFMVQKFVMVSTDKAVNPSNVMGASKRIAEIYIQTLNDFLKHSLSKSTRFVTTRFGNVLDSNGSVIPRFRKQIAEGGPVTVTHPEIRRFFMTIPEACQLVLEAGAMGKGGEIFIFDMGESIKIVDLAKKMIKLSGLTLGKDIQLVFTGLRPGEKLYEELLANHENTVPTHHPKILIAHVRVYDFDIVKRKIAELISSVRSDTPDETVRQMKELVPEYISQNSRYEKFDKSQPAINI